MKPLVEECPHAFPTHARRPKLEDGTNMIYECQKCFGFLVIEKTIQPVENYIPDRGGNWK